MLYYGRQAHFPSFPRLTQLTAALGRSQAKFISRLISDYTCMIINHHLISD